MAAGGDDALPAHDVIERLGNGQERMGKNHSVGHGLLLVKGAEAADANPTRGLWEISQGAGLGLRTIPRDHLRVIVEEGTGRDVD